jgi:hypothetical protein
MAVERFDFSCVVTLPDGTVAEIEQTRIQRDERQGMTFQVRVHPHGSHKPFTGGLHLAGSSLTHLGECSGATRREQSQHVVEALRAWIRQHGLTAGFVLEIVVGATNGDPCHVTISPAVTE